MATLSADEDIRVVKISKIEKERDITEACPYKAALLGRGEVEEERRWRLGMISSNQILI